ncbi:hypothetical protein J2X32_003136 [Rheinheimera pacifica]|uniref:hypothetical protein n=1 Tax=Rheinheimera pacifica TaxID=173990 RepID=UPI00285A470C|nr:hypothetical protein [Rheinheimera pacifica]MDR6984492.1 hypothetical protein [Rheinheimera pacifica]
MKKTLIALTLMASSVSFNAAAAGSIDAGDINFLLFYKGHSGLLIKHQYQIDPDNCGRRDYYILPDNHPHFSQIYALLLAAQTADKKVSFDIDGCLEGRPAITHVGLAKQ